MVIIPLSSASLLIRVASCSNSVVGGLIPDCLYANSIHVVLSSPVMSGKLNGLP